VSIFFRIPHMPGDEEEWEDLTYAQDGALRKRVLVRGSGEPPRWGAVVTTRCTAAVIDAEGKETPFEIPGTFPVHGDRGVLPGLLAGIQTMRKGEIAEFLCAGRYLLGEPGCALPPIPAHGTVRLNVRLVAFIDPDPVEDKPVSWWSPQEKLAVCLAEKEAGNELFRAGDYPAALQKYLKAKGAFTWTDTFTTAERARWHRDVGLAALLNVAACKLKLREWESAAGYCSDALEIQPDHPKALFRRAQARAGLEDYAGALRDLEAAAAADPSDAAVPREAARVKALDAAVRAAQRKQFGGMFRSMETRDYLRAKDGATDRPPAPPPAS